jgi:hypothetical protein
MVHCLLLTCDGTPSSSRILLMETYTTILQPTLFYYWKEMNMTAGFIKMAPSAILQMKQCTS